MTESVSYVNPSFVDVETNRTVTVSKPRSGGAFSAAMAVVAGFAAKAQFDKDQCAYFKFSAPVGDVKGYNYNPPKFDSFAWQASCSGDLLSFGSNFISDVRIPVNYVAGVALTACAAALAYKAIKGLMGREVEQVQIKAERQCQIEPLYTMESVVKA